MNSCTLLALITLAFLPLLAPGCGQSSEKPVPNSYNVKKVATPDAEPERINPIPLADAEPLPVPADRSYPVNLFFEREVIACDWERPVPKINYHIGVLFPTLEDSFWTAPNYGLWVHAQRLGITLTLLDAGGYSNFGNQLQQLNWMDDNPAIDGILLGTVDYRKLNPAIRDCGKPVISIINPIESTAVISKSLSSFYDVGYAIARFMIRHSQGKNIRVCVLPGPEGAGWSTDYYSGIRNAVSELKPANQEIDLSEPIYGDTRPKVQMVRICYYMDNPVNYNTDYILGNAVAAKEAVKYLSTNRSKHPNTKVISIYLTMDIYDDLKNGLVLGATNDQAIRQAEVALDLMVHHLNRSNYRMPRKVLPAIEVVTKDNISKYPYEQLFGPRGFRPVYTPFKKE